MRAVPFKALLALQMVFLSGCETLPQVPEVRIVKVPIVQPCVKDLPLSPRISTNQELNVLDDYALVIQLQVERLDLLKFSGEQSALLKACL